MAKLNWNRPAHRKIDDWKKDTASIRKKQLGDVPVKLNDTLYFGKYKGRKLCDVPTSYLEWLVSITDNETIALKYCRELAKRPEYE